MADSFEVGDRVGIKDSPDFLHWSAEGQLVEIPPNATGPTDALQVQLDGGTSTVPVLRELLVRIAGPGNPGAESGWVAQSWPVNGDRPGPAMYFASGRDLLNFVLQYKAQELDETVKVRVPEGCDAMLQQLKDIGAVEL